MNIDKFGRFSNAVNSENKSNLLHEIDNLRQAVILLKNEVVTMENQFNTQLDKLQSNFDKQLKILVKDTRTLEQWNVDNINRNKVYKDTIS